MWHNECGTENVTVSCWIHTYERAHVLLVAVVVVIAFIFLGGRSLLGIVHIVRNKNIGLAAIVVVVCAVLSGFMMGE